MCKALEVAKWFIKNGYDAPNTLDGNKKLNKLLYLAQLISLTKDNKPLFKDDLYAFKCGVVVENVRQEYKKNYFNLKKEALKKPLKNFSNEEKKIMNMTYDIFGDVSPNELSELTHQHKCWKKYYNKSIINEDEDYYDKNSSIIPIDSFQNECKDDLKAINNMLEAYEEVNNIDDECVEVNEIKFYYNPNEIEMNDSIKEMLENFPTNEKSYCISKDTSQGILIY